MRRNLRDNSKYLLTGITAVLLLFGGLFGAFAQETIAVHPISNDAYAQMARVFFEELIKAIPNVPGYSGAYRTYTIDLINNRPADVPPGGFPAYICPSPSVTREAPYAITGEMGEDEDYPGDYWMRMYVWEMSDNSLIASDMINARDRASSAESYPYVLTFLFSLIDEKKQAAQPLPPSRPPPRQLEPGETERYWLYVGLRGGGGNSMWYHNLDFDAAAPPTNFVNWNAAIQLAVDILPFFHVQMEANMYNHLDITGSFDAGVGKHSVIWNMTFPLLLKFNLHNGPVKAAFSAGPFLYLPMPWTPKYPDKDFAEVRRPMGLTYGASVGWKVGPGYIFADARIYHLVFFSNDGKRTRYPANGSSLNIGYEIGLISKPR